MGRHGPRDSAGTTHLYERFLGKQFPPLDAGHVTAQWSGHMARCANAVAPMLVSSEQGRCKSTFCELLMPDSLKDYYTDSFELTGQAGCEQKLASSD